MRGSHRLADASRAAPRTVAPRLVPAPKTASGGLRSLPHHRLSRWRLQAPDASGKNRPSYDRVCRVPHLPQSDACGSTNSALDTVRNGAEWLSLGADGLSIAATTTGVGAPIGGLVKGLQIGLEVGIAGINIYEGVQSGNFAGAFGQAAGRLSTALVPGAKIGNRIRSSAALNWGQNANGRLRQGFQHKIAGQNQAIDELNQGVVGSAAQGGACLVR